MTALPLLAALVAAAAPTPTSAPVVDSAVHPERSGDADAEPRSRRAAQGPDVELHVPRAEVKKVSLDVENLQARLDVDTRVANLVQISAGVVATVQRLKVDLEEVSAETHLVVRLERVAEVMTRALGAIDEHPDLVNLPPLPPAAAREPARPAVAADAATEATPVQVPAAPASRGVTP